MTLAGPHLLEELGGAQVPAPVGELSSATNEMSLVGPSMPAPFRDAIVIVEGSPGFASHAKVAAVGWTSVACHVVRPNVFGNVPLCTPDSRSSVVATTSCA